MSVLGILELKQCIIAYCQVGQNVITYICLLLDISLQAEVASPILLFFSDLFSLLLD